MRVLSVVGARPQFVKLAPVDLALQEQGDEHIIVHTGQHYDDNMSDAFFRDLNISTPAEHLSVGSDTHGRQTGRMLIELDSALEKYAPDWVLVYGDTNSTVAGALSAAKLHFPVAHLEAGLRSFNRRMPEELNRVATDHLSDLCLAPTKNAMKHLANEGLTERSVDVGDVMTDVLFRVQQQLVSHSPKLSFPERGNYVFVTIHRPDNTDHFDRLKDLLQSLHSLPFDVVLAAHPRLRQRAEDFGLQLAASNTEVIEPLSYPALVKTVSSAQSVITDSGGLQKEAFLLRIPCTTLRDETEWIETLHHDWNVLVSAPRHLEAAVCRAAPSPSNSMPYGDGTAAIRTLGVMRSRLTMNS